MKSTISQPQSWKRVIEVEIPHEDVETAFKSKLTKYSRDIKLPGFRPGKAPSHLVKSKYGPAIRAEMLEDLIQQSLENAYKEHNIVPIARPRINELKADEGMPVSFKIETEVDPEIIVKGYDKLKIKVSAAKIKAAQIDEVLDDLRARMATYADVDRASKKGDFVTLEYQKVVIDGQERADVSSPKYPIEIGASKIKEFDRELSDRKAGESAEISIKFPRDYADTDIAGKGGQFTIKIVKVQERILPEVNEEFLKKVGEFKDEAALREQIGKDLEGRELERAKNEAYNKAIDSLIKSNPFEVPPTRIEHYIDYVMEETKRYARPNEPAPTREQAAERYRETAVRVIKRFRIIDFIAKAEKIKATQAEVDAQIRKLADTYHQPFDQLKETFRQNGTVNRIREDLREQKTLDFLIGEYTPAAAGEADAAE